MNDPIVDEIRRIREEQAAKLNFDLDAIFRDLKIKEDQSGRCIVHRKPKRIEDTPDRDLSCSQP